MCVFAWQSMYIGVLHRPLRCDALAVYSRHCVKTRVGSERISGAIVVVPTPSALRGPVVYPRRPQVFAMHLDWVSGEVVGRMCMARQINLRSVGAAARDLNMR